MIQKKSIPIRFVESLDGDIREMHERIAQLAYRKYLERGSVHGSDVDDWLDAESELIWSPAVTLEQQDDAFVAEITLWDIAPEQIDVKVGGTFVLVSSTQMSNGRAGRQVFCGIEFPSQVSRDWTRAEFVKGALRISMLMMDVKNEVRTVAAVRA